MNGTSGFQEVRSSTSRSPSCRFPQEQGHRFGIGAWHLLHTHNLIALFTGISTIEEMASDIFSISRVFSNSRPTRVRVLWQANQ